MPRKFPMFVILLLRAAAPGLILLLSAQAGSAQQAGGVVPSGSNVHLVRVVVGAKGETRNGTFVMTEPRSVFYAPEDREVIVYFEWEGTRGTHHCEGSVRGPSGQFATMSSFDYVATQVRFAGFWKVPLSEGTPPGGWTFESRVDGEAAGQVAFQVIVAVKPADIVAARPLATPADIYKHAIEATVEVETLDAGGRLVRRSSGFVWKDGAVVTSFRGLDGAANVRLRFPGGEELSSPPIAAWDRRQDWVIFATNAKTSTPLKLAEGKNWNVGDHCYWLNVKTDGSRILTDGQIVGLKSPPAWGDRIDISGVYDSAGLGGALFNEQGEVIGVLGGALPDSFLNGYGSQTQSEAPDMVFAFAGGIAIAANLLSPTFPASRVTLQDLWSKGLMTSQITNAKYVLFGMLTEGGKITNKKSPPGERESRVRFQRSETSASALIHFANTESFKSTAVVKLYDVDNRLVATGKPEQVHVNRGEHVERMWQLPLASLSAGIFRVDVEVADGVAWRQYFKLTE